MILRKILHVAVFGLLLAGFAAQAKTDQVKDPLKYAEEESKAFAAGDSNDSSGWQGCNYVPSEPSATKKVECTGTRSLLIHGGHLEKIEFVCEFKFELSLSPGIYYVNSEICE